MSSCIPVSYTLPGTKVHWWFGCCWTLAGYLSTSCPVLRLCQGGWLWSAPCYLSHTIWPWVPSLIFLLGLDVQLLLRCTVMFSVVLGAADDPDLLDLSASGSWGALLQLPMIISRKGKNKKQGKKNDNQAALIHCCQNNIANLIQTNNNSIHPFSSTYL